MSKSSSYLNRAAVVVAVSGMVSLVVGCPDKGPVVKSSAPAPAVSQPEASNTARPPVATPPGKAGPESAAKAGNAFALELYQRLRVTAGNLFYSPFSIATGLGMTYAGAVGTTAAEMRKVLAYRLPDKVVHLSNSALMRALVPANTDAPYALHIANRLWVDKQLELLQPFVDITQTYYGAAAQLVDYREAPEPARATINQWVRKLTAGMIPGLLAQGDLDTLTRLVLTNAIYFKARWQTEFKRSSTRDEAFFAVSGDVKVPLMRQVGKFRHARLTDLAALELPYAGGALSMLILLPHARNGLDTLEKNLSPRRLSQLDRELQMRKVRVLLPRFKADHRVDLSAALSELGMPTAFGDEADFSKMVGKGAREDDLRISKVIHQAVCQVDEQGTEATAATAVVMQVRGLAPPEAIPEFRADHPFVFAIRHRATGAILFLGRLSQPTR